MEGNFTPSNTVNHVIVVGILDTMLVRNREVRRSEGRPKMDEVTKRAGRDRRTGGRKEDIKLQVRSPYGGMFALPAEIEPDVPGIELLETTEADTMLAIEGYVQLKETFDPRFATDRLIGRGWSDRGHPTRSLCLRVSRVRQVDDQEARSGSAVWLEGKVIEPPQVMRHPDHPSIQLAGTILRVVLARPSTFVGVPTTTPEVVEVNISVPTVHQDAEKMYGQGNRVRVIGQLDCRMEYRHGDAVTAKLDQIDADWAKRKEELAGKPVELRKAEENYRRLRQKFEAAPRLYVLAGNVDLLEGETIALADTYDLRREFIRQRRAQQQERRARKAADQAQRAQRATPRPDAKGHAGMTSNGHDNEALVRTNDTGVEAQPEAGVMKAPRPRRRPLEVDAATPAEVIDPAAMVEVEAT